ncbi:choice-of-anchor J domain-containing protein [uncultured Winogradskyella sp.]|uniref:T9SS-dependent choice-of-anchor J family protein n=1 Tax=uncultured Winogradskyella sp. TaxID=395353 RepID=UPI0026144FF4|nr:choice-of-anchor J domain-containing protein [uncultured Winogradskyella sp.]
MKKITLLITLIFSSSLMYGQIYFEDDFSTATPNTVPTGWMVVDGDGLTPNTAVDEFTSAWIAVDRDGSPFAGNYGGPAGDIAVASTSWYTPAGTSNDWLISPAITPTTDSAVTWDAKAQDATFADGYELLISTTGTNVPGDFGTVLFSVAAEESDWETRTIDLSAYTNQTIYLAWRNNSTDQFVLLVDNVIVEEIPSCLNPTDFVLGPNGITDTSADIAWTDGNGPGTVFDIEYGLDGFTPNTGTGTIINDIAATNYDFTSLMPDTAYDFYITANCAGGNGDSEQVGPIGFLTAFDCTSYGFPYTEDWSNINAYVSCYTVEDANIDGLSWLFNNANDLDGDMTIDNIVNVFPQAANVAKDDWLFTPAISGTQGAEYTVTVTYNAVDFQATANESFDLVITDSPASSATMQSVIGSYNNITQSGVFGDTGGNDLITQAYMSTATYTAAADGDFHVAIHANTLAADSDVFLILNIEVTETLGVNDFDRNIFTHNYDKASQTLNLESSNMAMTNVEVYSLLGQSVVSKSLNNTSESIDVSSLNDGIYLAKVNINGNSKTIKFVKN